MKDITNITESDHPYNRACACQECVCERERRISKIHPILANRGAEVPPSLISRGQALAMLLEMREEAEQKLAQIEAEISAI